jgi:hypothetical protein
MSHLLIIKDRSGKELAKVPVESGWSFVEIPLPKDQKPFAPATDVSVGDKGRGASKV